MKRRSESDLKRWWERADRKPLILRGARQVGKSTLVRLFCEAEKIDLIEINLEKRRLTSIEKEQFNLSDVLDEIQLKTKKTLHKNALVFLDEIQEQPRLLKMLRYFYEERPDIPVIAAGSLLELALRDESFSFPVGRVEFHNLGPMTWTEYLWATGNTLLAERISNLEFSQIVHEQALEEFRKFLYVGGMPEAIKSFVNSGSLISVRRIQEQIIQTYLADFPKYNPRIQSHRVQRVFFSAPLQLGKKVIYQRFDPHAQSRDTRRVIELLVDARVLISCFHSDGNTPPLAGESDFSIEKLYFLDVGLFNSLLGLDLSSIDREMENNFNTKGIVAEQFVAQHLAYLNGTQLSPQLHYWLRDRGSQKGEIDFLVQLQNEIVPVEVKARQAGQLKSLFYFVKEKGKALAVKLSLEPYSRKKIQHRIQGEEVCCDLVNLPIYAVETLFKTLAAPPSIATDLPLKRGSKQH